MSRKGSETPSKSKRLVDETDDFHVPSFNILSETQAQKSKGKEKCSSVDSKMEKNKIKEALKVIDQQESFQKKHQGYKLQINPKKLIKSVKRLFQIWITMCCVSVFNFCFYLSIVYYMKLYDLCMS